MYSMQGTAPNGKRYRFGYQEIPDYMEGEEWAPSVREIRKANKEAEDKARERAMRE